MKKMCLIISFIIICLMFVACNGNKGINDNSLPVATSAKEAVVVEISVSTSPENADYIRHYTNKDKIEKIRSFIRGLIWSDVTSEEPDKETGTLYTLTFTYEDSTKKTYYFKENQYFKFDGIDWKIISSIDEMKKIIVDTQTD